MESTDTDIIRNVLAGNKQQYALLMRKYNQRLYRVGKGYLGDEAEIEDAMQDTYVKAYQALSSFGNRSEFGTWITRILINECLQRLRSKKRVELMDNENKMETMNYTDQKSPETESMNNELKRRLENTIAALPEKYRSIFIMREVEKMSVAETSGALDISESNVKVRLNRAKEMLRSALMDTYPVGSLYEFNLVRCDRIAANVLARI